MKAESFLAESISFYIKIKKRQIELVSVLKFLLLESILCGASSSVSKSLHAVRRHLQNIHLKNCLEKISVNLLRFCKVDFKYAFFFFLTQGKPPRTDTHAKQSKTSSATQLELTTNVSSMLLTLSSYYFFLLVQGLRRTWHCALWATLSEL